MTRTGAALLVALATLGTSACGKVYDETASPATARTAGPGTVTTAGPGTTAASTTATQGASTTATQPVSTSSQAPSTTTGQGPGSGIIPVDAVPTDAPGVWEHEGTYYGTCQAIQASPYADRASLCSD